MSAAQDKAFVRPFCKEAWGKGSVDVAYEIFADGYICHDSKDETRG